ncbi:hypothetical protein BDY19DRAFT_44833 [Irpex rosettiformis]|uniref:Uncharacterized protein n=1 Tax=Irpex rosettiformis TaxID=378272 RepID=A0ACB8UKI8_9APHY|nr:hypothetical protein BDY19DRAFT_44833 [Irpex rosettiformis]
MSMQSSCSTSGQGIFFEKGRPLRIYLAADIENHSTLFNSLRAAGASTTFSPSDAQIILVSRGTQMASELLHGFPDKLFLDVGWANSALRNGYYAKQSEGWGGYFVRSANPELHDVGPSNTSPLPTPRRTPVPASNDAQVQQQQLQAASIDPTLLAYLSQALRTLPMTNQTIGPQASSSAFQSHSSVPLPLPLPSGIPPTSQTSIGNQQPAISQDILNLVSQLLNKVAYDEQSRNQFQAHQWPSQGISSSLFNTLSPSSQLSSSHVPSQSSSDSDLANTIMNALRSSTVSASTVSSLKRKSWQDPSDPSGVDEEDVETGQSTKRERMDDGDFHLNRLSHGDHHNRSKRVFTDEDGSPLAFYVLPSIKRRHEFVDAIKKHGGTITAEVAESRFVVLSLNADHCHETLRNAVASDVPAVKPGFIMECIRANSLLEASDFSLDGESLKRKRGLPILVDLAEIRREIHGERKPKGPSQTIQQKDKRSRGTSGDDERDSAHKKVVENKPQKRISKSSPSPKKGPRKFIPKPRSKLGRKRKANDVQIDYKTPRSPSPVAPNTVEEFSGKHRYTAEEREYWPKLVAHALKYDPGCTQQRLAQLLAEKMPHHPLASWTTAILSPHKDMVESLRKKAFVDARKAGALIDSVVAVAEASEQTMTETGGEGSRATVPVPRRESKDLDQDLEIVTQFLMDGGADNILDDVDVWKALQAQQPCRTQPNWEMFWDEHGEEVTKEIEERNHVVAEVKVETEA